MTDDPTRFDGEARQTAALAPENANSEQSDSGEQAQTVADEAMNHSVSILGLEESEKLSNSLNPVDAQDLVDHMIQMERGNTIDMSAYAGEPNHDDNVDKYGRQGNMDKLRGDGS